MADRTPLIRVTAMPADTNPYGGVFGGWLMGQMGLACGSFASRRTNGKAILVAADAIKFPGAMAVGDELSVNDLLIKALAQSLIEVPECNVSFAGDQLLKYSRADISVAVSIPAGLITPIIVGAESKSVGAISTEMKDLAARAKDGKLQPQEYQGGTASLSNMGMYGIKNFEAVINPPQGMIMAIGAGEKRPYVINDSLQIATVMSATGSFDHRAIDGADGAKLMQAFKRLVENPLGMLA